MPKVSIVASLQQNAGINHISSISISVANRPGLIPQTLGFLVLFCAGDTTCIRHPVITCEINWNYFPLSKLLSMFPPLFIFKLPYAFFKCSMSQKITKSFVSNARVSKAFKIFEHFIHDQSQCIPFHRNYPRMSWLIFCNRIWVKTKSHNSLKLAD